MECRQGCGRDVKEGEDFGKLYGRDGEGEIEKEK